VTKLARTIRDGRQAVTVSGHIYNDAGRHVRGADPKPAPPSPSVTCAEDL
jgi:hypothetical protein